MNILPISPRRSGPLSAQRLLYFVRVADLGSLTAAGESLGIAQPSLSAALRKLEAEIGLTLLQRSGRGVTLTAEGEQLLEHARTAVESIDRFVDVASSLRSEDAGCVSIAAPAAVSISVLGPLMAGFTRRHPGGLVQAVRTFGLSDTVDAVRHGRAELALLPRLPVPDRMEGVDVGSYELVLALPRHLRLPRGSVDPTGFDDLPLITSHPGTVTDRILDAARRQGARPRIVMLEPDVGALPQLVARGVGAAIVPTGLARELNALGVEARRFAPRELWPVRLVYRPGSLSPAAARFLSVARALVEGPVVERPTPPSLLPLDGRGGRQDP